MSPLRTGIAASATRSDFTGDGFADLLMLRNYGPGNAALMVLHGTAATGEYDTAPYAAWEGTWGSSKLASGDFTGDGKSDVLSLVDRGNASAAL
ncbi:FG-GAP repeat domain-containing protein [Amycolatopsis umgeniensis]|uniref:VCBS repeat-containing protein n=1 Tax=Amycolatopsis umgeniensis TaxID=336628 RepID=A0A841AUE8_9PSEU|nr:VCBS repeat-containing protein [Amycolatopsis umgeniensis]MBB5850271.1 hypothetical protein [Amycolatopsis umgeniensis]